MRLSVNPSINLDQNSPIDDFLWRCEQIRLGYNPELLTQFSRFLPSTSGEIFCRGEPEFFKESFLKPKLFRKENLSLEEAEIILDFKATFPEHEKKFPQ